MEGDQEAEEAERLSGIRAFAYVIKLKYRIGLASGCLVGWVGRLSGTVLRNVMIPELTRQNCTYTVKI